MPKNTKREREYSIKANQLQESTPWGDSSEAKHAFLQYRILDLIPSMNSESANDLLDLEYILKSKGVVFVCLAKDSCTLDMYDIPTQKKGKIRI